MESFRSTQAFDYPLPSELIAQRPVSPPDAAQLLDICRDTEAIADRRFSDLPSLIRPVDLIIFNQTRVIPARFIGQLETSGAEVELLILKQLVAGESGKQGWAALGRPLKKLRAGTRILLSQELVAVAEERISERELLVRFERIDGSSVSESEIFSAGTMPIPPYIRKGRADSQDTLDYQTIFAREEGSVAAPTASLHFTESLVSNIKQAGARVSYLTLHVGPASFLPLWHPGDEESQPLPRPGTEWLLHDSALVNQIIQCKQDGGRVIAVGTTVVRALESMIRNHESWKDGEMVETDLFIAPGFRFDAIDCIITNFHQPRTTHLLLVQAFMGLELLERSYRHALEERYRFLSYGDGMFIR